MIHFFPIFSKDAANTVLGRTLRDLGVPHRIFADFISFRYRSRLRLLFVCMPNLAWFALKNGARSLRSTPRPDAVILGSDIEVLVFALLRRVLRSRVRIVHGSFIYTGRPDPRTERRRLAYYRLVMRQVDLAFVHSRLEVERYAALFPGRTRFAFIAYGMALENRAELRAEASSRGPAARRVIVSAGRSGRDYATLFAAVAGLDVAVHVICDYAGAIPAVPEGADVRVLTHCHDDDYLLEMACADIVVVPLAATDISAGQMVLIQAKALGRPLIVTDTPTVRDYVENGKDGLLVRIGDAPALRAAISQVLGDAGVRARLESNASESFDRQHRNEAFIARQVQTVEAAFTSRP